MVKTKDIDKYELGHYAICLNCRKTTFIIPPIEQGLITCNICGFQFFKHLDTMNMSEGFKFTTTFYYFEP